MSIETLFFTQIVSILSFVVTLFILYRLLVQNKDSTIKLLQEKISFLKERLTTAENQDPDILVERLTKRAQALADELKRLQSEQSADMEQVSLLKQKLNAAQQDVIEVTPKLARAQSVVQRYSLLQRSRIRLLDMYDGKCQVCGSGTRSTTLIAHIRPITSYGSSTHTNLLCLCANHHELFTHGRFAIAHDYALIGLEGKLHVHSGHYILPEHLAFHREHVYQSKSIMVDM